MKRPRVVPPPRRTIDTGDARPGRWGARAPCCRWQAAERRAAESRDVQPRSGENGLEHLRPLPTAAISNAVDGARSIVGHGVERSCREFRPYPCALALDPSPIWARFALEPLRRALDRSGRSSRRGLHPPSGTRIPKRSGLRSFPCDHRSRARGAQDRRRLLGHAPSCGRRWCGSPHPQWIPHARATDVPLSLLSDMLLQSVHEGRKARLQPAPKRPGARPGSRLTGSLPVAPKACSKVRIQGDRAGRAVALGISRLHASPSGKGTTHFRDFGSDASAVCLFRSAYNPKSASMTA